MNNQLIVYTPKKNVKKMVLRLFLGILISISIFLISAFSSAIVSMESKWNKSINTNNSYSNYLNDK